MNIEISICILTYNNAELLSNLLYSIKNSVRNINYEIIVVDSGSIDSTKNYLKTLHSDVILIENIKFKGFSSGNNQAFNIARGRHILMLNDDTLILEDAINLMHEKLSSNENIGAIGPRLLNIDLTTQYSAFLSYPTILTDFLTNFFITKIILSFYKKFAIKYSFNFLTQFGVAYSNVENGCSVKHLMGACILFRKSLIYKIGQMDENYYLSLEDQDWCKRIIEKGAFSVYYLPEAKILHYGSQSVNKLSEFNSIYFESRKYFQQSNYGKRSLIFYKIIIILMTLINIPFYFILKKVLFSKKYKNIFNSELNFNYNLFNYIIKDYFNLIL